ncbi:melanoma-associated antigen C1 [Anarrhichthys ocellatus]|uniref:melanoma-associated antigen C1 n=1 Tax=Anarrhichthys ocellatus TaxID=433405 RepID=UPI0012EE2E41|nr:zinc finger B-box domain-containing protein 1 [Anarrhichthys ocellatus]
MQVLQMETVTLGQESTEMEQKLQQLKESMSKEKEERGHSGGFRWKSGQRGSLNSNALTSGVKKNKEDILQKLSAGKVKIRVLKDEPLTAPPPPPPPPRERRKNRLKGTRCGQCEIKTAGLMCAECTEHYCIGCFTKFHQKGALKLHRMIPIQTDLQTHVSTRDVVSCFQKQTDPRSYPITTTSHAAEKPVQLNPDPSQVLTDDHGDEEKSETIEEGQKMSFLNKGDYNEVESARSFQEALRQWRGEKSDGSGEPTSEDAMWTPIQPVSVSVMATQSDLSPNRGGGEERVPVRVEFTENSLTYVDRLLLKKHRRTPVETYRPLLAFGTDLKSMPKANTGEETASSLTAQEEDFRHYCASMFAVPVSRGTTEPQITTPESCLVIEVLDERDRDINGVVVAERRTDNNRKVPSVEPVLIKGALVPQTALTTGSSRVCCSSPSPAQASRPSIAPAKPKAAQKVHLSKPQTSQAEHSITSSSSKSKLSVCLAAETPRTSKTSIKMPTAMSQKPKCPPNVHKSNPDRGSIQVLSSPSLVHSQTETPKFSSSLDSFPPEVSPLAPTRPTIPEDHLSPSTSISFSFRSTFTVSPSSSTESTLLPKVYHSTPLQRSSDSSLLREQPQTSRLSPEPIPLKLSLLPPNNLESPRQSQHSCNDPESLPSNNQLQLPLSPLSSSPNPSPKSLEPSPPVKNISSFSLFNASPPDACSSHGSTPTNKDFPVIMSSSPVSGEHELTLGAQCIPSLPSQLLAVIKDSPLAVKMEEEGERCTDSGDEMSTDSLGLAPHEEDSSDEEAQLHGLLARGGSRDEQGNPAIPHSEDPFVPADAEREKDLQTHEEEQLSNPSMVMHNQSAGPRSEQFCDPDGFPPLGLDLNSDTPEHTHCDLLLTGRTSPHVSDPTDGYRTRSSLRTHTEEHLVFRMMSNNRMQPTANQIHSTRPTSRGQISVNRRGTSELGPGFRPLSRAAMEIMEICNVDHTGCEDPDLESDTAAHALHGLEQELRLMAKETWKQASLLGTGDCGGQDQHGNSRFTRGRASDEQNDEEEAATQRDRQSVLLLP